MSADTAVLVKDRVDSLFTPAIAGALRLKNRVVMAPMTRIRAQANGVPTEIMAQHYGQRASAGLIITEATYIAPEGKGYAGGPGIASAQHTDGWKPVVDAVHQRGGLIALQIWHAGRASHSNLIGNGELPVAPSAIAPAGNVFTGSASVPYETPRALRVDEMPRIVALHVKAAERAFEVGFDAVEIHAANGYLLDEFLRDGTNARTDEYGGSLENRARLTLEVVDAVAAAFGGERVGVRLSPFNAAIDTRDSNPRAIFGHVSEELGKRQLAYLHVSRMGVEKVGALAFDIAELRRAFKGTFIANGGFDRDTGAAAITRGDADLIAYGKIYTSNPDLVERFKEDAPLTRPDPNAFYMGGAVGYTDFHTHDDYRHG